MTLLLYIIFIIIFQYIIFEVYRLYNKYNYEHQKRLYKSSDKIYEIKNYKFNILPKFNYKNKSKDVSMIAFSNKMIKYDIFGIYYQWLSNHYDISIIINNIRYKNNDEYFQLMKYKGNKKIQKLALQYDYKYKKDFKKYIRDDWESNIWNFDIVVGDIYVKDIYMFICNYYKFTQYEYLRRKLIDTGDSILIYHTKMDKYWGSGEWNKEDDFLESLSDIQWKYGKYKKGYNVLGQILMLIRRILQDENHEILNKKYIKFSDYSEFFIKKCLEYNFHIYKN